MILLIDNYDSFSYNLYQLVGSIEPDITVVRNDAISVEEVAALAPQAILLSPGPGRPADAGICEDVVRAYTGKVPIMGVCLGHQAICEALGGVVTYAERLMHGKSSKCEVDTSSPLFRGLPARIEAGRYHSLAAEEATLPDCLHVIARTCDNGEIMAVAHGEHPTFGLQFHPESILTPTGERIARNFICLARKYEAWA